MSTPRRYGCAARLAAIATVFLLNGTAAAKDLGVRGETWAIAEPDLLQVLEARLHELEQSGAMAAIEEEARARVRARIEVPEPVAGIAPATELRSRLVDPSVILDRDVRLPDGTLLAAAGTRLNPLEHVPLSRDLLFIDGRRPGEVSWALSTRVRRRLCCSPGGRSTSRAAMAVRSSLTRAGALRRASASPRPRS